MSSTKAKKETCFANKAVSVALSVVLAFGCAGVVPTPALAAEGDQSVSDAATSLSVSQTESTEQTADQTSLQKIDISDKWSSGPVTLDEAGEYYLSKDVETQGTLTIAAPAGQEIALDFKGHSVKVSGQVVCGIDASTSLGTVKLFDSAKEADAEISATLEVQATGAVGAVCGVMVNAPLVDEDTDKETVPTLFIENLSINASLNSLDVSATGTHDCYGVYLGYVDESDVRDSMQVSLVNCDVQATVDNHSELTADAIASLESEYGEKPVSVEETGIACGVFTNVTGVALAGDCALSGNAVNGEYGLYATVESAFNFVEDFTTDLLTVNCLEDGAVFGFAATAEQAANLTAVITSLDDEVVCVSDDTTLFCETVDAEESIEALSLKERSAVMTLSGSSDVSLLDEEESGTDLAEVVAQNSKKTNIKVSSGTYYLSDDLLSKAYFIIQPNANVTIKLNGHRLTINCAVAQPYNGAIYVPSTGTLKIEGEDSEGKKGAICVANRAKNKDLRGVVASYGKLEIGGTEVKFSASYLDPSTVGSSVKAVTLSALNCAGVYVLEGDLSISNSLIEVDSTGIDRETSSDLTARDPERSSGVLLARDTGAVTIDNTSFTVRSNAVSTFKDGQVSTACGISASDFTGELNLANCTFNVASGNDKDNPSNGKAIGIDAQNVNLSGTTSINAASTSSTWGVINHTTTEDAPSVVRLNDEFAYAANEASKTGTAFSLESSVANLQGYLSLGESFKGENLSVQTVDANGLTNAGEGVFAYAADGVAAETFKGYLSSFTGGSAYNVVEKTIEGKDCLALDLNEEAVVARVGDKDTGTPYVDIKSALAGMKDGETLYLLKQPTAGLELADGETTERSVTVDLNGFTLPYVRNNSAKSTLTLTNPVGKDGKTDLTGTYGSTNAAALNSSTGTLVLDGLEITSDKGVSSIAANDASGIVLNEGAGTLKLNNTDVTSDYAMTNYAIALANKANGTMMVDGGSVTVTNQDGLTAQASYAYYGKWANINGELVGSSLSVTGDTAINVVAPNDAAAIYLDGSAKASVACNSVSVESLSAVATGVIANKGSVAFAGTLKVAGANAYGVTAEGECDIKLNGVDFALSPDEGGTALDVVSGLASESDGKAAGWGAATLTLSGTCKLGAGLALSNAVALGDGFALAEGIEHISLCVPYSTTLQNGVFATGSNLTPDNNPFVAAEGSWYKGADVEAAQDYTYLRYKSEDVVQIVRNGDTYTYRSLAEAINAATADDTLTMLEDYTTNVSLPTINKGITIDLNSHKVTVASPYEDHGLQFSPGDALLADEPQVLTIKNGAFTVELGKISIKNTTQYNGIVVSNGSGNGSSKPSLSLDNACVNVTYAGSTSSLVGTVLDPSSGISIRGVRCAEGNVTLANSTLKVSGSEPMAASGAVEAQGIYAAAAQSITVDKNSTIQVENYSNSLSIGSVVNANTASNLSNGTAYLREISPSEDSDLYKKICEEFFQSATYWDSSKASGANAFKLEGVYVASPMQVGDMYIYAVSNYVPTSKLDDASLVKPAKMWVLSTFDKPTAAYGITTHSLTNPDTTSNVAVNIEGSVRVSSSANAYGVYSDETGATDTWNISGATFKVSGGEGSTWGNTGSLNLRSYLEELGFSGSVLNGDYLFPSPGNPGQLVDFVSDKACGISVVSDKANVVLSGQVNMLASGADACDITAPLVKVGADFSVPGAGDEANLIAVRNANGGNMQDVTFATAADGTTLAEGVANMFCDADGKYSVKQDGDNLEWGGTYKVSFVDIDEETFASSSVSNADKVAGGTVLTSYEDCLSGNTLVPPAEESFKRENDGQYVREFLGWHIYTGAAGEDLSTVDVEPSEATVLVEGNATYVAVWQRTVVQSNITFSNVHNADGTYVDDVAFRGDYGQTLSQAFIQYGRGVTLPDPQDYQRADGKVMCFVGWKISGNLTSETQSAYDDAELMDVVIGENNVSGTVTIKAKYVAVDPTSQALVTFKEDSLLYAYAVDAGEIPLFSKATQVASHTTPVRAKDDYQNWQFSGWAKGLKSTDATTIVDYNGSLPQVSADYASGVCAKYSYSACFKATEITAWVGFWYYKQSDDGTYIAPSKDNAGGDSLPVSGQNYTTALKFPAGSTNVGVEAEKLVPTGTTFAKNGYVYEFVGWSARNTDLWLGQAMYTSADLPATLSTNGQSDTNPAQEYCAVYKRTKQTVTATFVAPDGSEQVTLGTYSFEPVAEGQTAATYPSVTELMGLAKVTNEAANEYAPEGMQFAKSWTVNGQKVNATSDLSKLVDQQGNIKFVAEYTDQPTYTVTLNAPGNLAWTSDTWPVEVKSGSTVAASLATQSNWKAPYQLGKYFTGWTDDAGNKVDLSTYVVTDDATLSATYGDITVSASDSTSADVSKAAVTDKAVSDAASVTLSLKKVTDTTGASGVSQLDGNISRVMASTDTLLGVYSVDLSYEIGDTHSAAQGFTGSIDITMPVDESQRDLPVALYQMQADGTVYRHDPVSAENGTVTYTLATFGQTTLGNLALVSYDSLKAAKQNALDKLQEELNKYYEGDYTDDDWSTLTEAFNTAGSGINAATSAEGITSAFNEGAKAMAAVPSKRGLDTAKAEALLTLTEAYNGYTKSDYSTSNWNTLVAAFNDAKNAISEATTTGAAYDASGAGVSAMGAVQKLSSSGSLTGNSSGTGSGLSSSGSGGSGLTSSGSTGSGLTTSGSTGSGLTTSGDFNASAFDTLKELLGASFEDVTEDLASENGLAVSTGVYVDGVQTGSAAEKAGLQQGDVVTAVNGTPVSSMEELVAALQDVEAGSEVKLTVSRNGKDVELTTTLDKTVSDAQSELNAAAGMGLERAAYDTNNLNVGGEDETPQNSFMTWVADNWILLLIGGLLILAALAALVWWLLRRRAINKLLEEGEDEDFSSDSSDSSTADTPQPALSL